MVLLLRPGTRATAKKAASSKGKKNKKRTIEAQDVTKSKTMKEASGKKIVEAVVDECSGP